MTLLKYFATIISLLVIGELNLLQAYTGAIAHRGGSSIYKENTLPAIQHAIAQGVDGVEIDVQMTKDKVIVLYHDETLIQGDNAMQLRDLTYSEIKQLEPTLTKLSDVLKITRGRIPLLIEVKAYVSTETLVKEIIQQVRSLSSIKDVEICSFNWQVIQQLEKEAPFIRRGIITAQIPEKSSWEHINFVSLQYKAATEESVAQLRAMNKEVYVWTVNERGDFNQMYALEVDAVITDNLTLISNKISRE